MADQEQFGRALDLELGSVLIQTRPFERGLRTEFKVERDKSEIPNSIELAVWNLNEDTRSRIEQEKELLCRLKAGYGDAPGQIFTGIVSFAESIRDGTDWVLRVSAGDGQNEYSSKTVSESFSRGTPVQIVLLKLVKATGLGIGNASKIDVALPSGARLLEAPYIAHGSAFFELQVFADSLGLDWSFQDGQFIAAKAGEPYSSSGPLLTRDTGCLTARLDDRGNVSGSALLLPTLLPGTSFRTEMPRAEGDFVCSSTIHEGDTYDEKRWNVHFDGIPLGATSDGLIPEKETKEKKPPSAISLVGL